jgi:hypothetical protein
LLATLETLGVLQAKMCRRTVARLVSASRYRSGTSLSNPFAILHEEKIPSL